MAAEGRSPQPRRRPPGEVVGRTPPGVARVSTEGRNTSQNTDLAPDEFPARLGKVARRELAVHGYTRYEQLTTVTPKQLLAIHGVGPKAIRILGEELAERNLSFAEPA